MWGAKLLCISRTASNFYGTEIEIWAGFGPVDSTAKINLANNEQLLSMAYSCFHGQFFKILYLASALKSCMK